MGKFVWEVESMMPYSERNDWLLYIQKNGPLNPSLRMEAAIGRAVLPFLAKGTKLTDLMPWPKESEPAPEAVQQLLMGLFKAGGATGGKVKYKVKHVRK